MKLYKFRELSLKDQMRIEVDFYGEPVEISEEKIGDIIRGVQQDWFNSEEYDLEVDIVSKFAKAILNLLE